MVIQHARLAAVTLVLSLPWSMPSMASQDIDRATDAAIRAAIEMPHIPGHFLMRPQFTVAPDRRTIAFVVEKADIATNSHDVSLWTQSLTSKGPPRRLAQLSNIQANGADIPRSHSSVPLPSFNPSYSPDGSRIAVIGTEGNIQIIDATSGVAHPLQLETSQLSSDGAPVRLTDVHWSPKESLLAVFFEEEHSPDLNRGVRVTTDWGGGALGQHVGRVAIIDITSGRARALTPANLDITGFTSGYSWSPDGHRVVFGARRSTDGTYDDQWTDLYLLDVEKGSVQPLLVRDGIDMDPLWSPDGRWIAFLTQNGEPMWKLPPDREIRLELGLYRVADGFTTTVAQSDRTTHSAYGMTWYDDDHVIFTGGRRMGCPLFITSVTSGNLRQITPDDLTCIGPTAPGPSGSILTVRSSFESSRTLVQSSATHWSPVVIAPTPVAQLPPATTQVLTWPSRDGKFDIHGVLITPKAPHQGPRPLFVVIAGGPSMVTPDVYNPDAQQLIYPALLRGFAILVPNTRGRGGYGQQFANAIVAEKSNMRGPLSDAMAGVDLVTDKMHAATRDRMVLAGFSFGGGLAAFAAANTNDFSAIIAADPAGVDLLSRAQFVYGSTDQIGLSHLIGATDPYNPEERAILTAESPLTTGKQIRTPLLIECGAISALRFDCARLFRTTRSNGTPSDLILYPRSGHGISEPALRYDSALNGTLWIDRWVGLDVKPLVDE